MGWRVFGIICLVLNFPGGTGDGSVSYDTGNITYSTPIANVNGYFWPMLTGKDTARTRASNGSFANILK